MYEWTYTITGEDVQVSCDITEVVVFVAQAALTGVDTSSLTISGCVAVPGFDLDRREGFIFTFPSADCNPKVSEVSNFSFQVVVG